MACLCISSLFPGRHYISRYRVKREDGCERVDDTGHRHAERHRRLTHIFRHNNNVWIGMFLAFHIRVRRRLVTFVRQADVSTVRERFQDRIFEEMDEKKDAIQLNHFSIHYTHHSRMSHVLAF